MVLLRLLAFRPAGQGVPQAAAGSALANAARPASAVASPSSAASAVRTEPAPARRELLRPAAEFRAAPVAPTPTPTTAAAAAPARAPVVVAHVAKAVEPVVMSPTAQVAAPLAAAVAAPVRPPAAADEPPPWVDEPSWVRDEAEAEAPRALRGEAAREPMREPTREPAADAEPPSRVAQITFTRTPQQDRWMAAIEALFERGSVAGLVRELAWQAECTGCDEVDGQTVWRLKVERESLRQPSHRDRLQAALAALFDRPQRLEVDAGVAVDSAARRDMAAKALRQAAAEDLIHADPVVRQLLATFPSARIVPGSIRPR
jgi:DNA polymerase-3 subunit gamma/tau